MNDITLLREAGPDAPPLRPEALQQARAALLTEIEASTAGRRLLRMPSRKARWRIALALTSAAAAWTAAVVIAAPDPIGPPPGSVTLVAFEPPTFPLSLDPVPAGMKPAFSGDGEGASFADYRSADGEDRFTLAVSDDEPELQGEYQYYDVAHVTEASVGGAEAQFVRGSYDYYCDDGVTVCERRRFADLVWERRDDQWVHLRGEASYSGRAELMAVAESLVDRPQPATLSVGLAPAGWSVIGYKDGRILTLANDAYPEQTMNIHLPLPEDVIPADELLSQLMGPIGPVISVTVNERPAQLVRIAGGPIEGGWYLQAQFADGTTFVLQAPEAFTQDDVLAVAAQVTYTP